MEVKWGGRFAVTFGTIAGPARGPDVGPGETATLGDRIDVILRRWKPVGKLPPTIGAFVLLRGEDVRPVLRRQVVDCRPHMRHPSPLGLRFLRAAIRCHSPQRLAEGDALGIENAPDLVGAPFLVRAQTRVHRFFLIYSSGEEGQERLVRLLQPTLNSCKALYGASL